VLSGFWLLSTHFRARSGFEIFTSVCVFRCGCSFGAVALSLQNLFRTRFSWSIKETQLVFEVDLCSDAASLLHGPAATFTTLCEYREDSPGYE